MDGTVPGGDAGGAKAVGGAEAAAGAAADSDVDGEEAEAGAEAEGSGWRRRRRRRGYAIVRTSLCEVSTLRGARRLLASLGLQVP